MWQVEHTLEELRAAYTREEEFENRAEGQPIVESSRRYSLEQEMMMSSNYPRQNSCYLLQAVYFRTMLCFIENRLACYLLLSLIRYPEKVECKTKSESVNCASSDTIFFFRITTGSFINLLLCEQVNQWVSELFLCDQIQSNRVGGTAYQEAIILTLSSPVKRVASLCTSYDSTETEFPSYPAQRNQINR